MTMRFAASCSKPAPIYARGNIRWRQSSSHSNAICHHSFKKRVELRTQEQPLFAKHIGGTIRAWNGPSRNRRTDEVPFIASCSHFTWKNTRFRAPASSPKQTPCNIHAAPSATTSLPHHFPSSPLHCQSFCDVLLCNVKSHTTLHQGQSFCDVLLCSVKSQTTLHQGQVSVAHHSSSFQVSEFYLSVTRKYCFPTSFDYYHTQMGIDMPMITLCYLMIVDIHYRWVCIPITYPLFLIHLIHSYPL